MCSILYRGLIIIISQIYNLTAFYVGSQMEWDFISVAVRHLSVNDGISVPQLDDFFEDVSHIRTGKVVMPRHHFRVYYHASRRQGGVGDEGSVSIFFIIDERSCAFESMDRTEENKRDVFKAARM